MAVNDVERSVEVEKAVAAGHAAFEAGRFGEALSIWSTNAEILAFSAADPFWIRFAVALRRVKDLERFQRLRESLAARGRPHVMVHLQFALLLKEQGKIERALAVLEEVHQSASSAAAVDLLKVRVSILADAGRFDEAVRDSQTLEGLDAPKAVEWARFCMGLIDRKRYSHSLSKAPNTEKLAAYWRDRRDAVYIHVIKQIVSVIAKSAGTVADIGSNATPLLDYFPERCEKFSVDPGSPYEGPGVTAVREDFYHWSPPRKIQIVSCFQVMEHVREPEAFARRLLELGEVCVVSVPYKEPAGLNPGHIHAMIDESTIEAWFGRKPNYHYVARELDGGERIICVFDAMDDKNWPTLCAHCERGLKFRYRWSKRDFGKDWLTI